MCTDQFDPNSEKTALQVQKFCEQYCFNDSKNRILDETNYNNNNNNNDEGGGTQTSTNDKKLINLSGVLHYYKSFLVVLLNNLNDQV